MSGQPTDYYKITGEDVMSRQNMSNNSTPHGKSRAGRRSNQLSTSTASSFRGADDVDHRISEGYGEDSMIYLNVGAADENTDNARYGSSSRGGVGSSYTNAVSMELQTRFPKEAVPQQIPQNGTFVSDFVEEPRPASRVPDIVEPRTMIEDWVDLPASHNILWLFIALGIAFVTGVLVMVLYTEFDAMNEGATAKVLSIIIIVPAVYAILMCGINCYGRQLSIRKPVSN